MKNLNYTDSIQALTGWLAVLSLFTFILSLILIPWIVGKLPQDCFAKLCYKNKSPVPVSSSYIIFLVVRNAFGILLLLAGIAMLFLPGQGLLTILLGIILISFPGKKKLIFNLVNRPKVQRSMDWLRKKRGKKNFIWPRSPKTMDQK